MLLILLLAGCNSTDDGVLYRFTEMQCVDYSWEGDIDEEVWAENVRAYLEDDGIKVNNIEALNDHGVHCRACGVCPTGRTIEVWINEEDIDLIESLGFVKDN